VTLRNGLASIDLTVSFAAPPEANSGRTFTPRVTQLAVSVSSTGGSIPGLTNYYYYIVPIDSEGRYGKPSRPIEALIPSGTNTNAVTISGPSPFDDGAVNYEIYRSNDDPYSAKRIAGPTAVPAIGGTFTFVDTGLSQAAVYLPDDNFAGVRAYFRKQGDSQWTFGAQTADRSQTSVKFPIPYNVDSQVIEIQLRSLGIGNAEMPAEVAPIFSYTVTGVRGQLAETFINNPVDTGNTPTSQPLTQSGTSTTINVAASTFKFGSGTVSYNSGSVNPGSYGTFAITADDLSFAGGAVAYAARSSSSDVTASRGRLYFGMITTTGGGGGGGTGGGAGGCVRKGTWIRTANGKIPVEKALHEQVLTPDGLATVIAVEEIENQRLYRVDPVNDGDFETIYCSGDHTLKIWGLWEHLRHVHIESQRGHKIWAEGTDVGYMAKISLTAEYGTVVRIRLDKYHIYSANGIWSHNAIKTGLS